MDDMVGRLKSGKRRQGVEEILIPGERSARSANRNRSDGVTLNAATITELNDWCTRLGVVFDATEMEI